MQNRRSGYPRLLVLGLVVVLLLSGAPRLFAATVPGRPPLSHVVAPGETLWALATRYRDGRDPRDVIYDIQQLNHLKSVVIQPGERILVP
jgi:hypothetical protein